MRPKETIERRNIKVEIGQFLLTPRDRKPEKTRKEDGILYTTLALKD